MTQPTFDDVPRILNSISWQLKRIADALENKNEIEQQPVDDHSRPRISGVGPVPTPQKIWKPNIKDMIKNI